MTKEDIRLEMKSSIAELRGWAARILEVSPALSKRLGDAASSIESKMAGRGFDSDMALLTMGKAEGLITAAQVLMDEWYRYQRGL